MKRLITILLTLAILLSPATAIAEEPEADFTALFNLTANEPALLSMILPKEQPPEPVVYTVVEGDSLTKIGVLHDVTWQRLWGKNIQLKHQDQLEIGSVVTIPAPDEVLEPRALIVPVLPKNVAQPIKNSPNAGSGWYDWGNCTAWVASKRPVGQWNDATDWLWQAKRDGWTTSAIPVVGAVAWEYGHVSFVEAVNETTVSISEMNYKGLGVITYRTRPISDFTYIY